MFAVMTMQRRAALSFLLAFLMVALSNAPFPAQARGGVEIVSVQSQGLGMTQRDAILDGVREAVSMVNFLKPSNSLPIELFIRALFS